MSLIVKAGKAAKKVLKSFMPPPTYNISYTRRLERIRTDKRICAMTFDDGPMDMPSSPDCFDGRSLTDVLLDTLAEFGAKGTFDIVGDTSENYPDEAGKSGSAAWGGIRYDHYPDFGCDDKGGAEHNDRLIRRMLDEGHQITNHGYRHIIFGKKPFVYGERVFLGSYDKAVEDLTKLDTLMKERYGYTMTMSRPPHYVDKIDAFTSYDVYDTMGYQYMAASFDGQGWLPSTLSDGEAALEAEVEAMVEPVRRALENDPDFFCGQIIFQKDGYNMAKRTPVAFGLRKQLELLKEYGYEVVTVNELLEESPFADVGREDELFDKLCSLQKTHAICYSNNTLNLAAPMTYGELAMLLAPKDEALGRRYKRMRESGKHEQAYCGAVEYCIENGLLPKGVSPSAPVTKLPEGLFAETDDFTRRGVYKAYIMK